ncbi:MAG: hypothetical protein C0179_01575 [Fervidicoccus sp.]|nr:MAG: hypothetical protein C0179_01575 [Fervidicoccus sp.]
MDSELIYLSNAAREHGYDMTRMPDSGECWEGLTTILGRLRWFYRKMRRAKCVDQVDILREYAARYVRETLESEEVRWYLRGCCGRCEDWPEIVRVLNNLLKNLEEPVRNMGDAVETINSMKYFIEELEDYDWTL